MTTYPTADHRFVQGATLIPLELVVQSFPFDPSNEETYEVSFRVSGAWSGALVLQLGSDLCEVTDAVQDIVTERWSFRLSATGFPADLPPGMYHGAFKVSKVSDGTHGFIPSSGRLLLEVLPVPVSPP